MLAVRAARLFDGVHAVEPAIILLDGATVVAVGAEAAAATASGVALTVDLGGATLLPGLVDAHLHLIFDGSADPIGRLAAIDDETALAGMRNAALASLHAGITTVRDLGDRGYLALRLREAAGLPVVLAAGPPVTTPRGHCWYLGGEAAGVDRLRAAVRERAERGVDVVKVMASGGELTPGTHSWQPQYTVDELRVIVEQAHGYGLPVTAHAHAVPAIRAAVDAGVDSIEHCSFITADGVGVDDRLIGDIAAAGITVSFTCGQMPGAGPPLPGIATRLDGIREALQRMRDAGVTLVCSSDSGIAPPKPHGLLPYSVASFVDSGFSTVAALRAATSSAAVLCGLGRRKGRLAPGYDADVLAVAGDPLVDIAALRRVVTVFAAGRRVIGGHG